MKPHRRPHCQPYGCQRFVAGRVWTPRRRAELCGRWPSRAASSSSRP